MKKYFVISDEKTVIRCMPKDRPADAICELPEGLKGKAFKIIEETNELGDTVKRAVLDEVAEAARLDAEAAREAAEAQAKLDREARRAEIADLKSNMATLTLPEVKELLLKLLDELGL